MTNKKIVYKPIDPEIEKLVHQHGGNRESVIEVLSDLNAANNLNPDTMLQAARALRIPAHQVYGMATFYSMLAPLSQKNVLRVCDGPACWLKRVTLDPGGVLVEKWAEGLTPRAIHTGSDIRAATKSVNVMLCSLCFVPGKTSVPSIVRGPQAS